MNATRAVNVLDAGILSIAPMMEWTDRNYRYLMRLLTRRTQLWTEMVVADTLLHAAAPESFIRFSPEERPIVCQLGGSDPEKLARAAKLVENMGYDAINLNCGCPSNRVAGKGAFGARLMFTPELVRDCIAAMRAVVSIPVSVKCRLGADDVDSYEAFVRFIGIVAESGCDEFVVHARKCMLNGLNPKENRSIPPLRYDWVQRAALEFPHLRISINGGVSGLAHAKQLLALRRCSSTLPALSDDRTRVPPSAALLSPVTVVERNDAADDAGGCRGCSDVGDDPATTAAAEGTAAAPAAVITGKVPCATGAGAEVGGAANVASDPSSNTRTEWDWTPSTPRFPVVPGCEVDTAALPTDGAVPSVARDSSGRLLDVGGSDGRCRVLHSVMIGRVAYANPWQFADADRAIFGDTNPGLSRREVIAAYLNYCDAVVATLPAEERGVVTYRPGEMMKPLMGLFHGCKGCTRYRQALAMTVGAGRMSLREGVMAALEAFDEATLNARSPF